MSYYFRTDLDTLPFALYLTGWKYLGQWGFYFEFTGISYMAVWLTGLNSRTYKCLARI